MVRPLILALLASASLVGCGGDDGDRGDLPESFSFTIDNTFAPCVDDTMTIAGARDAAPTLDVSLSGPLSCAAATDVDGSWSILCSNAVGSVDVRLVHALDAGQIIIDHQSAACDVTLPMLTIEILAP